MTAKPSLQRTARFAIPRTLAAGFLVAALATLVIAIVNYRSAETRADAVLSMDQVSQSMRQLNLFNAAVKDAELGQRNYLLTGDDAYVQPYETALATMQQHMQALKAGAGNFPALAPLVVQLDELSRQKQRELTETTALRKGGDAVGAMTAVHSGAGKANTERIRDVVENLRTQQNLMLETRRQQWVDAAANSNIYSGVGSLLLLALISISALLTAREYRAKATQSWISAGLNGLGQRIQGDHRLEDTGALALEYLADYLKAAVGAGYVAECNGGFSLIGGYALPRERLADKLLADEGLVGQAARSRQLLHVRDVPAGYLAVSSATGKASPAELLVAPAIENREVFAVIELGFNRPVSEAERTLMERASEMLAVAIRSGIDRNRLQALLEETQRQSEELQTQQEELRVNNEELEQQSRVLQESQAQMEVQQTELEQTNAHLEEQTQQLEYQREQMLRAQSALTDKARELEMASEYKSEFLANMSHELRTPLNSTLILAKLLADNQAGNLSADQVKYAQTIYAAGNDLLALINDILDLSKIEAGQATVSVEPVNIAKALQALVDPLRPLAADKGLQLDVSVAPRCARRHGNRPAAPGPGAQEPAVQRHEVHRKGHGGAACVAQPRRDTLVCREGHRHRHPGAPAGPDLRGLPAGRWQHAPQVRRHGAGAVDLARSGAVAGRQDIGAEHARGRQRVHPGDPGAAGTAGRGGNGRHTRSGHRRPCTGRRPVCCCPRHGRKPGGRTRRRSGPGTGAATGGPRRSGCRQPTAAAGRDAQHPRHRGRPPVRADPAGPGARDGL